MITNSYTKEDKIEIASKIKDITMADVEQDMERLMEIGIDAHSISGRSKIGNNVVDYFTFVQRLDTKGKYNASFFDFLANLNTFKEKKFIQNMLRYYAEVKNINNTKHEYKVYKEVYNICISAINIMRPLNCMEMYTRYNARKVLNFCSGWGGAAVAAAVLNIESYIGLDINHELIIPYEQMFAYLQTKSPTATFQFHNCDAAIFDYSTIEYDTVFTSPPYYFLEQYPNNVAYTSKADMNERFYKPAFSNTYRHLKTGGHYIINVCKEIYDNVLQPLLGDANEIFPLKKSKRQNDYSEMIYVWLKN